MEHLIPQAEDGSEFIEQSYDLSQAQAEGAFGAEFGTDGSTDNRLEEQNHD